MRNRTCHMIGNRPSDRGLSLPEVLVSLGLALILMGLFIGAWKIAYRSERSSSRWDRALTQTALLEQRLRDDMTRLVFGTSLGTPIRVAPESIGFWAFDPAAAEGSTLVARPVVYRLSGGRLTREVVGSDADPRPIPLDLLESLRFSTTWWRGKTRVLVVDLVLRAGDAYVRGAPMRQRRIHFEIPIEPSSAVARPGSVAAYPVETRGEFPRDLAGRVIGAIRESQG